MCDLKNQLKLNEIIVRIIKKKIESSNVRYYLKISIFARITFGLLIKCLHSLEFHAPCKVNDIVYFIENSRFL